MNMKMNHPVSMNFAALAGIVMLPIVGLASAPLSDVEADRIVEEETLNQAEREADRRAQLRDVPANQEWVVNQPDGQTIFRLVVPPVREPLPANDTVVAQGSDGEEARVPSETLPHTNFTLYVTVFDQEMTEIRFAPVKDGLTVVSNIPFTHLPAIETIEGDAARYSFFSFVQHVSDETEATRARPDPTLFSGSAPEYIVYAEGDSALPEGFSDAVDVLHGHYLKHQTEFKAKAERAEALRAGLERYLTKNPPEPRETVINFSPIRSREPSEPQ